VKISSGGFSPKEVCFMSSPSFAPWLVLKLVASPGGVCGRLRLL
jgi:hypothetical protein